MMADGPVRPPKLLGCWMIEKRPRKPRNGGGTEESVEVQPAADDVTQAMNRVVDRLGNCSLDAFGSQAARVVLKRTEWK